MTRYRFKTTRLGFEAGRVIDDSTLKPGVIKTLLDFNAIEIVQDAVDAKKDDKPSVSGSNTGRSKGSSSSKRKQSGRSADKAD